MSYIIFKKDLSSNILYDFLKINCIIENEYLVLNKLIFKKYEYNNIIQEFYDILKLYYRKSKIFYLEREISYNNLLTVIRQICRFKNINYFSKIKYDRNKYNIIYYIKYSD
tara:strand:- start:373 stop:705 length:333 start_codon:yes stop_codon:yes gene_type:complete